MSIYRVLFKKKALCRYRGTAAFFEFLATAARAWLIASYLGRMDRFVRVVGFPIEVKPFAIAFTKTTHFMQLVIHVINPKAGHEFDDTLFVLCQTFARIENG
jgi:hypothetical protein